jgi:hypothetical protein
MLNFGLLATEEGIRVNNSIPAATVDEEGRQTQRSRQSSRSRLSTAESEWNCMMECPLLYQAWRTFMIKKTKC